MATRKPEQDGSVIGPGLRVTGDVRTRETLRVLGVLDGNVQVEGAVEVGEGGRIRGDVQAQSVVVAGRVDGNVTVTDKVDLRLAGRIRGDITAPRVAMVEGSFFRGRLTTAGAAKRTRGEA
jgi:cytoskeletal protein CcmA (bactofilin family)